MSRERPILFSGEMVRAILDGRKAVTRRVVKPQPPCGESGEPFSGPIYGPERYEPAITDRNGECVPGKPVFGIYDGDGEWGILCPYQPGDRLWVRETWAPNEGAAGGYVYRADVGDATTSAYRASLRGGGWTHAVSRWRPSIHMPRPASRITLEITEVGVERLQELQGADAVEEGIELDCPGGHNGAYKRAREEFVRLWDSLNAPRGFGWDANPWVWRIAFTRMLEGGR